MCRGEPSLGSKVGNQLLYSTHIAAQTIFLKVITRLRVKRGGVAVHSVEEDLPWGVRWALGIMTLRWVGNQVLYNTQIAALRHFEW